MRGRACSSFRALPQYFCGSTKILNIFLGTNNKKRPNAPKHMVFWQWLRPFTEQQAARALVRHGETCNAPSLSGGAPAGRRRARKRRRAQRKKKQEKDMTNFFTKKPGDKGFNKEATRIMRRRGLLPNKWFSVRCARGRGRLVLMAYQRTAAFLLSPRNVLRSSGKQAMPRLLVVHRTGSGKTLLMILMLAMFYTDPRPKVLIFPRKVVLMNFYAELMKFPNPYRTYVFRYLTKREATLLAAAGEGRPLSVSQRQNAARARQKVIDILAMKEPRGAVRHRGKEGYLAAPLRAFTYSRAGGATVMRAPPTATLFKILYDRANVLNNKIIFMDEIHNLVKPKHEMRKYAANLKKLKRKLSTCSNSVVVGVTATPIVDSPSDGRALLDIIKGVGPENRNDEGFVTFFDALPTTIYPHVTPDPALSLAHVVRVPLVYFADKKSPGTATRYVAEARRRMRAERCASPALLSTKALEALQNYCNASGYYTQSKRMAAQGKLGYRGTAGGVVKNGEPPAHIFATKLFAIARRLAARTEKALVLIRRGAGFKILQEVMSKVVGNMCGEARCWVGLYDMTPDAQAQLDEFNSRANAVGQRMRAMIVDSTKINEGLSVKSVRRLYVVNPNASIGEYRQGIGRVLRACAYAPLRKAMRTVHIEMFVAVLPATGAPTGTTSTRPPFETADQIFLRRLQEEHRALRKATNRMFKDVAVDRHVLARVVDGTRAASVAETARPVSAAAAREGAAYSMRMDKAFMKGW